LKIDLDGYFANHMASFVASGAERGIMLDTLVLIAIKTNPFPHFLRAAGFEPSPKMQEPFYINGGDILDFFQRPNFNVNLLQQSVLSI
jgi:hypothetical protein